MLALAGIVYFVFLFVLFLGLRSRRTSERDKPETEGISERKVGRWLSVGGVLLPTVVLTAVFVFTLRTMNRIPQNAPKGSLTIDLVGHRWWWDVHYPSIGISDANVIHIPVGKPVAIRMTSTDVIHSFWVPELSGKMDAFPDYTNELVLVANKAGSYKGVCAEFCGLHHARMPIVVIAQSEAEFASWLTTESQPSRAVSSESEAAGKRVFNSSGCAVCHMVREEAAQVDAPRNAFASAADASTNSAESSAATRKKYSGPELSHQANRSQLISMRRERTRQMLAQWITDPASVKSKSGMPATPLSSKDLNSLLDYLESLK
jgi:cytochrome c oxidase subunit II